MSAPLRVLVVDDEALARRRLERLVGAMPEVELVGTCDGAAAMFDEVEAKRPDVVLLDVRMPGLDGIEAKALLGADGPSVVYVTAHAEHALSAFDVGARDYVLKPVEAGRLKTALDRVRGQTREAEDGPDRLAVSTREGIELVDPQSICAALLEGELVRLVLEDRTLWCDLSLQALHERLGPAFERVHRRALVRLSEIRRLEPLPSGGFTARTTHGHAVEISRQAARRLRRRLAL